MKNFKKVLALVLCVVMALGLISTANAAFTDAESITKTEAVDVLTALGVIGGYPDGSFKPEGDVTRAEMAKMVAYIMNEGEDVGDLYKNACAFTDSASHWAAGYIAYCANEGIISGKSPTIFDPDGKVTGTEAAKMLLCALGYNADSEGFKGSTWASSVLSAAAKAGLVGKNYNLTVAMGEPLNRDNAAQMMLNALQATTVEYENQSTITIGGVTINNNSKAQKVEAGPNDAQNIAADGFLQLAEVKFPTLRLAPAAADDFQRLGNQWTYQDAGFVGGPYAKAADLTYKDTVLGGTLYTDTGKIKFEGNGAYDVFYFIDGVENAAAEQFVIDHMKSGDTEEIGVVGDTIEVYIDTDNLEITFVQINYYAATVAQAWAEQKDSNGDVTRDAFVKLTPYTAAHRNAAAAELENGTTGGVTCTIATTAITAADKDAVVVYTFAANKLQTVEKTTSVSGTQKGITTVDGALSDVTVDSTAYKVAAGNTALDADYGAYDSDITIYLDPNGNVIYVEAVASNTFAYVMAAGNSGEFANDNQWKARLLFTDGTIKVVETYADYSGLVGEVRAYTIRSDGKYNLSQPAGTYPAAQNFLYKSGTVNVGGATANDSTVFVVETVDQDEVSTYTVYTGIKAVPSVIGNGATMAGYAKNGEAASIIYFLGVRDADIDTGATTTDMVVLFPTAQDAARTTQNSAYRQVKAVVNGEVKTLNVDQDYYNNNLAAGTITVATGYKVDANGIVTSLTLLQAQYQEDYVDFKQDGDHVYTGVYTNGVITFDDDTAYSVTSDVPVAMYNTTTKALTVSTISAYYPAGTAAKTIVVALDKDKLNADANDKVITNIAIIESNDNV
ncbi:MAG: S-layer homology domain-containing protein [Oscillospiraceae bacterium]|nr:S-layer homology domain-containing protein [Oscillospiraceae bacterium]